MNHITLTSAHPDSSLGPPVLSNFREADAWRDSSACRNGDPGLFYPDEDAGIAKEQTEKAKALCQQCQVLDQCLRFALTTDQKHGIWGGTTETERRKLRRNWLAQLRRTGRPQETWGYQLSIRRKALSISQEQLGQRVGVAQHTVERWESLVNEPSPPMKNQVAKALREFQAELYESHPTTNSGRG